MKKFKIELLGYPTGGWPDDVESCECGKPNQHRVGYVVLGKYGEYTVYWVGFGCKKCDKDNFKVAEKTVKDFENRISEEKMDIYIRKFHTGECWIMNTLCSQTLPASKNECDSTCVVFNNREKLKEHYGEPKYETP